MSPTETNSDVEVSDYNEDTNTKIDEEASSETAVPDESKLRKLYIDGLPLTANETDIVSYFEKWGEIEECLLTTSTTTILCCLTFAFATSVNDIQVCRPHRIGNTTIETKRTDGRAVKKLYVGSIKGGTTTGHIFAAFSRFGRVRAVDMIKDKFTGRCRGFCFVSFDDYDSADRCLLETPLVLNHKVVRVQKAIPISEMIKSPESGDSDNNKAVNSRVSVDSQNGHRVSISSMDTDLSEASSVFEDPFDLAPISCAIGLQRKEFGFKNPKPARHYSYPVYKNNYYAKDPSVGCYPPSIPVRNCLSYKPGITDLKAPYNNAGLNGFVPYLNDSTPASLQCPVYPDAFPPFPAAPQNGYPLGYNVACPPVPNRNLCFPFVFNNQTVPYSPLPTAPMFIPLSMMCNYTTPRPSFSGHYQNPYI